VVKFFVIKSTLILFFLMLSFQGASACYYISPVGDDTNAGNSGAPFLTPEKAQSAMQGGNTKCTYVQQGTYLRSFPIKLTSLDNGETWAADPANSTTLSAIFDGQRSITDIFLILGGSNITIDGLKMQNVIYRGVGIHGGTAFSVSDDQTFNVTVGIASNNTVKNTEVYNVTAPFTGGPAFWNTGGVVAEGNVPNTQVLSNYFHDTGNMGMRITNRNNSGDDISNALVQNNVVLRSMRAESDGGAIYIQDVSHTSTNIVVKHNYIADYQGPSTTQGHGIYLDQATSNVTVTSNFVRQFARGDEGTTAFIADCGNNINISNNIIDLGSSAKVAPFAFLNAGSGPCTTNTSNAFTRNIIVSDFAGNQTTHYFGAGGYSYEFGGSISNLPSISNNMYFNAAGGQEITTGNYGGSNDTSSIHADPKLISQYALDRTSPALSAPMNFVQLGGEWGPPGFVLP
jgi:hypothetical protein